MHIRLSTAFILLAASCGLTAPHSAFAAATIASNIAVNDRDGYSDTGAAGPYMLRPDGSGGLIIGSGFDNQVRLYRSGMEFDIAGTRPIVQQATLTYTFEVVSNPPAGYTIHGYAGDGNVSAADLLTNNPIMPTRSTEESRTVDVTAFIQSLVNGGTRYAGFMFSGFPGGSGLALRSSEPFINAPTLAITSVPEPTTAVLAVAGLFLASRRGRSAR